MLNFIYCSGSERKRYPNIGQDIWSPEIYEIEGFLQQYDKFYILTGHSRHTEAEI